MSEAQEQEPDVVLIGDSLFSHLNVTEVSHLSVNADHNIQCISQALVILKAPSVISQQHSTLC